MMDARRIRNYRSYYSLFHFLSFFFLFSHSQYVVNLLYQCICENIHFNLISIFYLSLIEFLILICNVQKCDEIKMEINRFNFIVSTN